MTVNQINLFLVFIINGIFIGLLFDFFRILRRSFKTNNFVTYIEDCIFWILTGISILYTSFTFNNGEIRLYMFISILIGVVLYILLISKYVIKVNVKIIELIKNSCFKIFKFLSIPLKLIVRLIKKTFFKPIIFFIINMKKIFTSNCKKILNNQKNLKR